MMGTRRDGQIDALMFDTLFVAWALIEERCMTRYQGWRSITNVDQQPRLERLPIDLML